MVLVSTLPACRDSIRDQKEQIYKSKIEEISHKFKEIPESSPLSPSNKYKDSCYNRENSEYVRSCGAEKNPLERLSFFNRRIYDYSIMKEDLKVRSKSMADYYDGTVARIFVTKPESFVDSMRGENQAILRKIAFTCRTDRISELKISQNESEQYSLLYMWISYRVYLSNKDREEYKNSIDKLKASNCSDSIKNVIFLSDIKSVRFSLITPAMMLEPNINAIAFYKRMEGDAAAHKAFNFLSSSMYSGNEVCTGQEGRSKPVRLDRAWNSCAIHSNVTMHCLSLAEAC